MCLEPLTEDGVLQPQVHPVPRRLAGEYTSDCDSRVRSCACPGRPHLCKTESAGAMACCLGCHRILLPGSSCWRLCIALHSGCALADREIATEIAEGRACRGSVSRAHYQCPAMEVIEGDAHILTQHGQGTRADRRPLTVKWPIAAELRWSDSA